MGTGTPKKQKARDSPKKKKQKARGHFGAAAGNGSEEPQWGAGAASPTHCPSFPGPSSAAQSSPPSPARSSPPSAFRGAGAGRESRSGERQWGAGAASPTDSPSSPGRSSPAWSSPPSPARSSPPSAFRGAGAGRESRSGERQWGAGVASPTDSPSSPARSSPAWSSPPSPSRSLPLPSSAAPARSSSPTSALQQPSPNAIEVTPMFDIFLDDAQDSLGKAFDGIRGLFTSILKNDHLREGKLVTKTWGSFMIRVFSSASSMDDAVCALYRTHDLYLDSVLSSKKWYRFKDPQAVLPLEVESEGSVILDFKSNYKGLGCNPDNARQIKVGRSKARKHFKTLQQLEVKRISSIKKAKKALVFLVMFAEALRFPALEKWLLTQVASEKNMYIPIEYTELFHEWGTLSIAFHNGRDLFSKATEEVKKYCKTYDDICSLLGIVNKVNMRKQTKATKNQKKKKKKNREETEEAEASSDNKRRKKKKKKKKH